MACNFSGLLFVLFVYFVHRTQTVSLRSLHQHSMRRNSRCVNWDRGRPAGTERSEQFFRFVYFVCCRNVNC
jgi:hypothetical protein